MSEKWSPVTRCTDVSPGESVRRAHDPEKEPIKDLKVQSITSEYIGFDDGVIVNCSALPFDHYWKRSKEE